MHRDSGIGVGRIGKGRAHAILIVIGALGDYENFQSVW